MDIIIDDGSYYNDHVIDAFKLLFPKLKDVGIYVVDDTKTSYWENYGGDNEDLNNPKIMMIFFKSLADSLNHSEFLQKDYMSSFFDEKIFSAFFSIILFLYLRRITTRNLIP